MSTCRWNPLSQHSGRTPQFRILSFVSGSTILISVWFPVQFPNQKDSLFAINGRKFTAQLIPAEGHQEKLEEDNS
jgi:hypothetical protein